MIKVSIARNYGFVRRRRPLLAVVAVLSCHFWLATSVFGRGSAPVYEDPFDVAGGGASLTRASQAGMIFSNPALISYGTGFHRWLGNETTLIVGKDSVDFAKNLSRGGTSSSQSSGTGQFVETVLKTPIHAGVLNSFAYINRFFGFSVFNRGEFDIAAKKYADTGLPAIRFRSESYQGVGVSGASLMLTNMISVGATAKFVEVGEPDVTIELTDQEAIKNLQSPAGLKSLVAMNMGYGYDVGMILFKQGQHADYRLALKVDDVGGTKLAGNGTLKELKQMYHLGIGYTAHNSVDSLHLSADYRDVQSVSGDGLFKRVRVGAKLLFRKHLGVSAGYYDGWPSYGLELDAWLVRLTAVYYKREFGAKPGLDSRGVYAVGFAIGI